MSENPLKETKKTGLFAQCKQPFVVKIDMQRNLTVNFMPDPTGSVLTVNRCFFFVRRCVRWRLLVIVVATAGAVVA